MDVEAVDGAGTALVVLGPDDVDLDARSLLDLYGRGGHTLAYPPYRTREALADWLSGLLPRARSFVAVEGTRVVGHAVLVPEVDGAPEFAVFVDPAYRDRGVAGELLRRAVADADDAGMGAVVMHVQASNGPMLHLARSNGFRDVTEPLGTDQYALHRLRRPLGGQPGDGHGRSSRD